MERLFISAGIMMVFLMIYLFIRKKQKSAINKLNIEGEHIGIPMILYFLTDSCGVCKSTQKPALEILSQKARVGSLNISYINAIEDQAQAKKWQVMTVPTTIVIDSDEIVQFVNNGFVSYEKLYKQLKVITERIT